MSEQPHVAAVRAAAADRPTDGPLVLVFADSGYVDVLVNWLLAVDALERLSDVLIVALDDAIGDWLRARGFSATTVRWSGALPHLWSMRMEVVHGLVTAGRAVVLSDADAVWLADPLPETTVLLADHDLVASQGTVWPPSALMENGAVACCGYLGIAATAAACNLLDRVLVCLDHQRVPDDQAALNEVLADSGTQWTPVGGWPAHRTHEDRRFGISDQVVRGAVDGMRAALLPMSRYQRLPLPHAATVVHHVADKQSTAKLDELQRSGALLLRTDWRTRDANADDLTPWRRPATGDLAPATAATGRRHRWQGT